MNNLTPDELARLRLKAKHGTLTPEEQRAYNNYVTEQLSAVPSPPSGAVPPKKGFKWESEKIAEWRLKARHDGLDENERLLYQDYQQTLALAEEQGWQLQERVRSTGRMDFPEPLILEYDVTEWMNKTYRGSDNDRRCMPELNDSYRGYVRISTAFFDGGYDIDDSTNKEE